MTRRSKPRLVVLQLVLSAEEAQLVQSVAKADGFKVSRWLRNVVVPIANSRVAAHNEVKP